MRKHNINIQQSSLKAVRSAIFAQTYV